MTQSTATPLHLPPLPVLGWATFTGRGKSTVPAVVDLPNAMLVRSGRAGIALALRALGVGRGDRVLVPTYHCPTMIAPIVAAGAEPVFFPIDDTGAPILDRLGDSDLSGVKAMLAAHYFGIPQPMAPIRAFCDARSVSLIEDCAHCMFGYSNGRPVGAWGDYAVASLTKFFPVRDGGCLVANSPATIRLNGTAVRYELKVIANSLEIGASYGTLHGLNRVLRAFFKASNAVGTANSELAVESTDGYNSSVDRHLADFVEGGPAWAHPAKWSRLIAALASRERIIAVRRRNYGQILQGVSQLPGVRPLRPQIPEVSAPYVFPLWVDDAERCYQFIRAARVPVFRWDDRWPNTPALRDDIGDAWSTHVFQLGCHQDLNPNNIEEMCAILSQGLRSNEGPSHRK